MVKLTKSFTFFVAVSVFAIVVSGLYLGGEKHAHAEIVIAAPAADVWRVIVDAPAYKHWNPVFVPVSGTFGIGNTLRSQVTSADGELSERESLVVRFAREKVLNQYGGWPLIFTFNHSIQLVPDAAGVRVIQHIEYRGVGVWLWDVKPMMDAYEAVNRALQARVLDEVTKRS